MSQIYYTKTFINRRWICKLVKKDLISNEYSAYDFTDNEKHWLLIRPWRPKDLDDPNIKDSTELLERNKFNN